MNIKPKLIPKFLTGGDFYTNFRNSDYFKWFEQLFNPEARRLGGTPLNRSLSNWNIGGITHHVTDDLSARAYSNLQYTDIKNLSNVTNDIQNVANYYSNKNFTPEQFRDVYNSGIIKMHNYLSLPHTYTGLADRDTASFNQLYNLYYKSKGVDTSLSGILYNPKLEGIYGTQTLLRDVDLYSKRFSDLLDYEKLSRIHRINLNGKNVYYYKENDGTIELLPDNVLNSGKIILDSYDYLSPKPKLSNNSFINNSTATPTFINKSPNDSPLLTNSAKEDFSIPVNHEFDSKGWNSNNFKIGLSKILPDAIATGRLIGNLWNNQRVLDETLKGMRPVLKMSYHTYRLVTGDEALRLNFYRKGIAGETKAGRAITSNMDTLLAYLNEMKAASDLLKLQGDIADNNRIKETSELSSQHANANRLRDTEVANFNLEALNAYGKAVHDLKAAKLSADWTSIDNALLALETRTRAKQERNKAILDLINQWGILEALENDSTYLDILREYNKAWQAGDWNKINELSKLKLRLKRQYYINYYLNSIDLAKKGTKITYKKKEDLLYKTAKDNADHFRKMVKLTSDSNNRKRIKIDKLTSHPKGTRKYLLGGVAPFTIFRPATVGGETTISSQSSTTNGSSKKSSDKDETLDMIKELFKTVAGKGLPSDVQTVYKNMQGFLALSKFFGTDLDSGDIASMYLQQMNLLNSVNYMQKMFDDAKTVATSNDALNEYAVTSEGYLVGLNQKTGDLEYAVSKKDAELKGIVLLTNNLLLMMRAQFPKYAFNEVPLHIVSNGIGISKIASYIKGNLPAIKESVNKTDSYVKAGIDALLNAPAGDYKLTITDKTSLEQAKAAVEYVFSMLPKNMQAVLKANAEDSGVGVDRLIADLITSNTNIEHYQEYTPVTGKAANNTNGSAKSEENVKSNPIMQMIQEQGGIPRTWEIVTKDSNIKMSVNGTYYSLIPKVTEDMSIDKMLSESGISGILDSRLGITFGDLNIYPELLKDIMYSNSGGMIVTLPCKIVNGHKEINLGVKKSYEEAILEVESKGISKNSPEYNKILGEVLKLKGLTSLLDSNGYPDKTKFSQFLVVEAYATSKIKLLDPSSQYLEKVKNPDELLELRLIRALSTDNKKSDYSLDIDYWFWGDDVYRGSVFIPLTNNINASINAWGDLIKIDESRELENKFLNFNKASTAKSSNSSVL